MPHSRHSPAVRWRALLRRWDETEGNGTRQAIDNVPVLGELSLVDAKEIGRGKAQLVAGKMQVMGVAPLTCFALQSVKPKKI
jgi:hypothetical protein